MKKLHLIVDQNSIGAAECSSDHVNALVLAAGVAETFTKPAGARFVRLSSEVAFSYNTRAAATVAGVDTVDGSASILVTTLHRPFFGVEDVAAISVISTPGGVVTAEFWG